MEPPGFSLDLLTAREVSDLLGVPVTTLYNWRNKGYGPPAARVGRHLRYRRAELDRWLDDQTRSTAWAWKHRLDGTAS